MTSTPSSQSTRVTLVLLAVMVAAVATVAFWKNTQTPDPLPEAPPEPGPVAPAPKGDTPAPDDDPGNWLDPADGEASPSPEPVIEDVQPSDVESCEGTPVPKGAKVTITVPYRKGTKSRYRITDAWRSSERNTAVVAAHRRTDYVEVTIIEGDGSGKATARIQPERFRHQLIAGPGRTWEFDSRSPDPYVLRQDIAAQVLKPEMASFDSPLEVRLAKTGRIQGIDGVEARREAFLDALDLIDVKAAREGLAAKTLGDHTFFLSEALFPPGCGGELAQGETRPFEVRRDTKQRAEVIWTGTLAVAHDDGDTFCVMAEARPSISMLGGVPRSAMEANVEKVKTAFSYIPDEPYRGHWKFDRKNGRLISATIEVKYRLDVSLRSFDEEGRKSFTPSFTDVHRIFTTELLQEE